MAYAMSVHPDPLHKGIGFTVRLRITAPDIVDGDVYEIRETTAAALVLNTAQATVPAGAADPCDLQFGSHAGFAVKGPCRFNVFKTTAPLVELAALDINVLATAGGGRVLIPRVTIHNHIPAAPAPTPALVANTVPPAPSRVHNAFDFGWSIVGYILPMLLVVLPFMVLGWIAWCAINKTPPTPTVPPPAATALAAPAKGGNVHAPNSVCTNNCTNGNTTIYNNTPATGHSASTPSASGSGTGGVNPP